ncbi:hypothetical protein N9Z78_01420 [Akkermansiaceae bacterium]|nr:hypothetical protein [Akkermansiaceae bacterium]
MRFLPLSMLVGGKRRTEARDEAEAGAGPEGGVERGGRHGVRNDPDAVGPEGGAELRAGWRDSCKRAFIQIRRRRQIIKTGERTMTSHNSP